MKALYNDDANKIITQTIQEKGINKSFIFLIDLAMVASNNIPSLDESQMFNKAWNHSNEDERTGS